MVCQLRAGSAAEAARGLKPTPHSNLVQTGRQNGA